MKETARVKWQKFKQNLVKEKKVTNTYVFIHQKKDERA